MAGRYGRFLGSTTHLIALEPRMMFDGAAVATAVDTLAPPAESHHDVPAADAAHHGIVDHRDAAAAPPPPSAPDRTVIFIDTGVADYRQLAADWAGRGTVVLVDAARDGVEQMRLALAGRTGIDAVHIVSHGAPGVLEIGTTTIDAAAVQGELAESFRAIGASLGADGDILIYGCDFGQGEAGSAAMRALAATTGADIAASVDPTGAAQIGGDWTLERHDGAVQSDTLRADDWAHLLARTNSAAWTTSASGATTSIDGVGVAIAFVGGGTSTFTAPTNDTFNTIAAFDNNAQGQPSLATVWSSTNTNDVGTITITFSEAVINPVINIDRLGGVVNGNSNSALITLLTTGATLTRLSGVPHFVVDPLTGTITRTPNVTTTGAESSLSSASGTAAGSVRVNGTFTTLTFSIRMNPLAAAGTGDGLEFGVSLDAPPVARNDAFARSEGAGTLSGNVLADNRSGADSDPRGDALMVASATNASGGAITIGSASTLPSGATLTLNANGTFSYVAPAGERALAAGQTLTDTFSYTITDPIGNRSIATATITTTGVNDAPVAVNDAATTQEDTPVTITVLANDSDPDGDTLTVTGASAPNGRVTVNADGTLTYTPNQDYNGGDTITYTISDGRGGTATATVAVTISAVDDPPVNVVPGGQQVAEDGTLVFSTANGNAVRVTDVEGATQRVTLTATNGTLSLSQVTGLTFTQGDGTADGTMTFSGTLAAINAALEGMRYVPVADYNGPAQIAMRTVTTPAPSPTFVNGGFELPDYPDTNNLHFVDESLVPGWQTDATDGVIEIWDSGFQNVPAYEGDQFAEINANQVAALSQNFQPGIGADVSVQFAHRGRQGVDTMRVVATDLGLDGIFGTADDVVLLSEQFSDGNTAWGMYSRQITTEASGNVIRFEFRSISAAGGRPSVGNFIDGISIVEGLTDSDTIGITVSPVADIADDAATTAEDTSVAIDVLANDSFENPARAITAVNGTSLVVGGAGVAVANGTVSLGTDGRLTFAPTANYNGTTSFTYTVASAGTTETATATVTVTPVNDAPVAVGTLPARSNLDAAAVSFATAAAFSDVDGDALTYSATGLPAGLTINAATGVISGTVDRSASQVNGGAYSVVVTARDPGGLAATQRFTWTITNPPPTAVNDTATTAEDTPVTIAVLANDIDPDGDPLTVTSATALRGTVTINANGTITYAPSANYNGSDTITYAISDGQGGTSIATVGVTITPVNDAPVAVGTLPVRSNADAGTVSLATASAFADVDGDTLTYSATGLPAGLTINAATGVISGTVDRSASQVNGGVYSVVVTARDPGGLAATQRFTWTITNPAPTAVNDTATTAEDTPVTIAVLANDTDPDGDPLTVTSATALRGTVTINADGTLTYAPAANYNGGDTITYSISDGQGGTSTATVAVTITPVNDAPIAVGTIAPASAQDGAAFTRATAGAFADVDGDTLTYSAAGLPAGLTIDAATGVIAGTIDRSASQLAGGVYAVTITARDPSGATATQRFTLTVTNPLPTAAPDTATTAEDTPVTIAVLANDADPDGDPLTVTTATAANGSVVVNANGTLTYTPDRDYNGTDTIIYTISDGQGGTATATVIVTVAPVNDPPLARDDAATTDEDTPVTIAILANDADVDGDALTITAATAQNGAVTINPDGTLTYTPAGDFNGTDTISYIVSDGNGGTATAIVTVTVNAVNDAPVVVAPLAARSGADSTPVTLATAPAFADPDGDPLTYAATGLPAGLTIDPATGVISGSIAADASLAAPYTVTITATDLAGASASTSFIWSIANPAPTAGDDAATTVEDTPVTIAVLANDVDPDGDALTVTAASAANGSVTINADGTLTYTPNLNFNGTDAISYTISDGQGGTATATVTVTVAPVNDAPVVLAPLPPRSDGEGEPVSLDVSAGFDDPDGDTLTYAATGLPAGLAIDPATGLITGTIASDAGRAAPYTVTITATDPSGATASTSFTWAISNPAPVAVNDAATTPEDTPVTIAVLANDVDPDGDLLTVVAARAAQGSVTINADGTLTYTPDADFTGSDTISYTISDGQGGTSTATVTVTVASVNDAPVAVGTLPARTSSDATAITFPVAGAFADVDGDPFTYTATGLPAGLTIDAATGVIAGTIDRTASQQNGGSYTVTITATDPDGASATQQFAWTVTNPAPTAVNDIVTIAEDTPVTIAVLANDVDPDGDPLTIIAATALRGTVTINPDGTLTYTPGADVNGSDTISYTVSDGQGGISTANVAVTITAVNDAPVLVSPAPARDAADGASVSISFGPNFADVDGDPLSYTATGLPAGLSIDPATGIVSGTIAADASLAGPYAVTITATDPSGASVSTSFTWAITNPAPVAAPDNASTAEDTPVVIPILANDSDPDGDPLTITAATALRGTVSINADGTLTYTPPADFVGSDTITYTITDGQGGSSTATVAVAITPVNDAPVSAGLPARTESDGETITIPVAAAFDDPDGDTLTYAVTGLPAGLSIDPATGIVSGTIAPDASQQNGGVYTVIVTATDPSGAAVSTSFTLTVSNLPPLARDDSATTLEDTPVTIAVLANDTDPDGDPLTPFDVSVDGVTNGTAIIDAQGRILFTPAADFNGVALVTYSITDGQGGRSTATVTITVTPVNDVPAAVPLPALAGRDGQPVDIAIADAFSDVDGDALTYTAAGLPPGLTLDPATGRITGTIAPDASAAGPYTVTITATDPSGATAGTSFTWSIANPTPIAADDTATTAEDTPVVITVLANDSDPDGDPLTITAAAAQIGSVTINANGTLTYVPATNFNGTDTIAYTISDGQGGTASATVTVTVTPVNDTPVVSAPFPARSDAEGEAVSLALAAGFANADGDALTYAATGLPAGLAIDPATGAITGTIASDAARAGPYAVTITATDPSGASVSTEFIWTITNPAPTAASDTATTAEGTPVTIAVLANDSDPDGDPLTVIAATAQNGTVTINPDGTLTYTPAGTFNGADTISYTISDGQGGTSTATVTITVTAVNDAPTLVAPLPARSDAEGEPVSLDLSGDFADADGDTLTYTATGLPAGLTLDPATGVVSGTLAADASLGAPYTVIITATDPAGASASASFTWNISNPAPLAVNDLATTAEDTPVTISVLANDVDPDGDPLTVIAATAANGAVTINPDGTLTYTPAANFAGSDTISYTISDGQGGTSTANVTVTVTAVNDTPVVTTPLPARSGADGETVSLAAGPSFADPDGDVLSFAATGLPAGLAIDPATGLITGTIAPDASAASPYTVTITATDPTGATVSTSFSWTIANPAPVAASDTAVTAEDTPVTIAVLANDVDPDGDPLVITAATAANGVVTINADGTLTYTPAANFNGSDTISYTISDGSDGTSTATVAVTITPVNDAPVARADVAATDEDTPVTIAVLANDSDVDGDPLTVTAASAANGSVTINADGTLTYTPAANFNGTDTLTYTISDGQGGTATATATITIAPVNDAPVAVNDAAVTAEDTPLTIAVLANDADGDGDPLTITAAIAASGSVTINADGTLTYTPSADFAGTDTITYTVSDGQGGTSTAQVVVTVTPVNDAPVANPDSVTLDEDRTALIAVLANDTDADGDPLTVTAATAQAGAVTINPDGTLSYTPAANFSGSDTITYTISDGNGGTATGTVTVAVRPVADAPVVTASLPSRTDLDGAAVTLATASSFADVDGDPLVYSATGLPPGLAIDAATGVVSGTITADASVGAPYTVTITATDPGGLAAATSFSWVIANPAPLAADDAATTAEDTSVIIPVLANDSDPDGDPLTVTAATAQNGTVTINPDGTLTYTPAANVNGSDTISYTISDGQGGTASASVTITVTPVNDAPVATPLPSRTDSDAASVLLDASAAFTDADGDALAFAATGLPPGLAIDPATGLITGTIASDASATGPYTVTVTAIDASGASAATVFLWSVTNPAPVAADDTAVTAEDTPVTIVVLTNDADPDGDLLSVIAASAVSGSVIVNADGTLTYTPAQDFTGTDTIAYTISDGQGGTSSATVTITVAAVNDVPTTTVPLPPRSDADAAIVSLATAGAFADVDGDTLTYTATGLPAGLAIDPATGRITGTIASDASASGSYTVTVTATDPSGASATTSFTWTVTNPAPLAADDIATTVEDTPVTIAVLANDSDPDGDLLTVTTAVATSGSVVVNADNTLTYTPPADFTGTDTITYTIGDAQGATASATVTITVTPANDGPVATPLPPRIDTDGAPVSFNAGHSFADPDGDALTYAASGLPAGLAIDPATGVITGTIAADASVAGSYAVTVTATDPSGAAASTSFSWTITNPAPIARDETAATSEDTPLTIAVLANDTDPDGDALAVTAANAANGTVSINADGTLTYTPPADFIGIDTITYTITDNQGGVATATVTITVAPANDAPQPAGTLPPRIDLEGRVVTLPVAQAFSDPDGDALTFSATGLPGGLAIDPVTGVITGTVANDASVAAPYTVTITATDPAGASATQTFAWSIANPAPTATDDSVTTAEDTPVIIAALANDVDPDGDTLAVTAATALSGTVTINPDGTLTYAPAADFTGTDTITYTIADAQGAVSSATITVTVTPVNDAPVAATLPSRTDADATPVRLDVAPAFSDLDGDTLVYAATGLPTGLAIDTATGVVTGTIARDASVAGTYAVTVTATDPAGASVSTSFTWTITNPAPDAADDTIIVAEDTPVIIPVLANDGDPDGDPLTITAAAAQNGAVTINPDGTLTYTPAADFNGTDTITYTISDGQGGIASAIVIVTVTPVNDAPVVAALPDLTDSNLEAITLPLAPAFSDADGDTLTFSATGLPPGLSIDPVTGTISGTIAANASNSGPYSVTITATDPAGASATTGFIWTISDQPPLARDDTATTIEDTPVTIAVLANDTDPDADPTTPIAVSIAAVTNGSATVNPDGTITFTPAADFTGVATITYGIDDGLGGSSTATVTITVTPANDAPTTRGLPPRSANDADDIAIPVAGAFDDPDGDTLTYSAIGLPAGLSIDATTGLITGTIASDASVASPYAITVTATDPARASVSATFTLTVANPAPVAGDDTATMAENGSLIIPVLANDVDPDGDALTIVDAQATRGAVTINADGTLTYVPAAGFNGTDTISYTISDGQGGFSTANVTVTVAATNDAPVATPLPARGANDGDVIALSLAGTFSDPDGDTLGYAATGLPPGLALDPVTGVVTGTIAPDASVTSPYTVTITATDPSGASATTSFVWSIANPAPAAADDIASVPQDGSVTIPVLANDADPDGDPLTVTEATAVRGTVTINADGTLTYTPPPGFTGTDTIAYAINDGQGGVASATVIVTVTDVNDAPTASLLPTRGDVDGAAIALPLAPAFADADGDPLAYTVTGLPPGLAIDAITGVVSGTIAADASRAGPYAVTVTATDTSGASATTTFLWTVSNPAPIAADDAATTSEDTPVTIAVLANDIDPDGDPLAIGSASAGQGMVTINADGTLTYTPATGFNGTDTISYTISDGQGGLSTANVTVTVAATNDAPVATPLPARGTSDGDVIALSLTGTFSDSEGDTLSYAATGLPPGLAIDPATGIVTGTIASDASVAGAYTVTITATDPDGASASTSFVWTIANPAPVATDDIAITTQGAPVVISPLVNDVDPDGDTLTVTAAVAANGTVAINADGTLTYTPEAGFSGADTIVYTISDGQGGTASATITITVTATPGNSSPVAANDAATTPEDTSVTIPVLANDGDADGDPLTVIAATAINGTVTINPDGTLTYTPAANFNGTDTITYTVLDGNGGTATSIATITVTPVNNAPVLVPDTVATNQNTPVTFAPLANDIDPDGDPLTIISAGATSGTVTINPDGTLTYTPAATFTGTDTITYTVSDGNGGSVTTTQTVTVALVNGAPVAVDDAATTRGDRPVTVDVLANDRDADGDTLTVTAASAQRGSVTINANGSLTYTPAAGFTGTDTISYTVGDGRGGTATAQLVVTVDPIPLPPTADVNQLLAIARPRFVDAPRLAAATRDYDPILVAVDPILLRSLDAIRPLGSIADLGGPGPIRAAIHGLQRLDTLGGLDADGSPVTQEVARLEARTDLRFGADRLFDRRYGDIDVAGFTGFSTRATGNGEVLVEAVRRGEAIYVEVREARDDVAPFARHELRMADGEAVPPWILVDPRGLIIIEAPLDADEIRLILRSIRENGTAVETPVTIQGATGEIEITAALGKVAAAGLDETAQAMTSAAHREAARLAAAFE